MAFNIQSPADFDQAVASAIAKIKMGLDELDELATYQACPTDGQFKMMKSLHGRLGTHLWED